MARLLPEKGFIVGTLVDEVHMMRSLADKSLAVGALSDSIYFTALFSDFLRLPAPSAGVGLEALRPRVGRMAKFVNGELSRSDSSPKPPKDQTSVLDPLVLDALRHPRPAVLCFIRSEWLAVHSRTLRVISHWELGVPALDPSCLCGAAEEALAVSCSWKACRRRVMEYLANARKVVQQSSKSLAADLVATCSWGKHTRRGRAQPWTDADRAALPICWP